MDSFEVNDYISLSFEDNKTIILVDNHEFIQCKSILVSIPSVRSHELGGISSVDHVIDIFEWSEGTQEATRYNFSSEEEFWAHCSNLQGWFEHSYDTHLLHSNLAFPLLKKLCEIGDLLAKKVFKEEIAKGWQRIIPL